MKKQSSVQTNPAAIFSRFLTDKSPRLSKEAAESILKMDISAFDKKRTKRLAERARSGQLTDADQREIEAYSLVGSMIGMLKATARFALEESEPTASRKRKHT